jgi:hypothetical protein
MFKKLKSFNLLKINIAYFRVKCYMYNGSTILLCVTILVVYKQSLIRAHSSIVTVIKRVSTQPKLRITKVAWWKSEN